MCGRLWNPWGPFAAVVGLGCGLGLLLAGCTLHTSYLGPVDDDPPRLGQTKSIDAGQSFTCAVSDAGAVRCWGLNDHGQLGLGHTRTIGDDEPAWTGGDLRLGGPVEQLSAAGYHACAVLEGGSLRCWGVNEVGELGYPGHGDVGDGESPASVRDVEVGGPVLSVAAGHSQTCALLDGGRVRCWGWGRDGELGYGNTRDIGDDETPAEAGDVDVGGRVVQLAAGSSHTCALLEGGRVRCWGGSGGRLGYGNTETIGDDETPAEAGDVDVGGPVRAIAANGSHTCAILETGSLRCWGDNEFGQLGYGNTETIGDDETPAEAGDVPVGAEVEQVGLGYEHTCAVLVGGAVRCWGTNAYGELGLGHTERIGDDETAASGGNVPLGARASAVTAGVRHTCALLRDGRVRCWGGGWDGQLGLGSAETVGDDETPASTDVVRIWEP